MLRISKCLGGIVATWLLLTGIAAADYPDKPVRLIVGYAPGGAIDTVSRLLGDKLSALWGTPVVVENKAGADGTIASDVVAHSEPDGYTITMVSSNFTIRPTGYKLNYDPVTSFKPVVQVAQTPHVLVANKSLPIETLPELIEYAKSKPGELDFGSSGAGTGPYMEMLLLMKLTGTEMVPIFYKGGAPSLLAVVSGETDLLFATVSSSLEQIRAGELKALGISTSQRVPVIPDVPTIAEATGLEYDVGSWNGVLVPAGTPDEIVDKLNKDFVAIINTPEMQKGLTDLGFVPIANSPEEFADFIARELKQWDDLANSVASK
jgi:tripartite-type tricarboxylate transporter receptor subunit TctC